MELRLKELRKKNGMKLYQLAKFIGVSTVTISRYENGEREPSLGTLQKLADFFDVPIDYLIGTIDDSELKEWREQKDYLNNNKEFIEKDFELLSTLLTYGVPESEVKFTKSLELSNKQDIIFILGLLFLRIGSDFDEGSTDFYDKLFHAVHSPTKSIKIID